MTTDNSLPNAHRQAGVRGRLGEDLAVQALETHGYQVIDRNWRCRVGEIDIIARDNVVWAFVEVKLRQRDSFVTPEEAVSNQKQDRLLKTALLYLARQELEDVLWRVDVVAIELGQKSKVERLDIYKDAVRADG